MFDTLQAICDYRREFCSITNSLRLKRKGDAMFSLFRSYRNCFLTVLAVLFMGHYAALAEEEQVPQKVLEQRAVAKACLKAGDVTGAVKTYQAVIEGFPGTEYALDAQGRMITLQIRQGNLGEAERLIGVFKSTYSQEKDFGHVLCGDIAKAYSQKGYADKARQLWIAVSTEFPAEPVSNTNLVLDYLKQEDMTSAGSQIDNLFTHVTAENGVIATLHKLGMKIRKTEQYALEQSIYDRLLKQFPNHPRDVWILASKAAGQLAGGDFSGTSSTVDDLFANHSGNADFVKYLNRLAYQKVRSAKQYALEQLIYDRLLKQFPEHKGVPNVLRSQMGCRLACGDLAGVSSTVDELLAKHSGSADLVKDLHEFACKEVRSKKQYALEESIYARLLKQFPNDERAPGIVASRITCCMKQNDTAGTEENIDLLFSNYTEPADSFLSAAEEVIKRYGRLHDAGMVIELCNRVLSVYPDHARSLSYQAKLVKAYLDVDSKSQADGVVAQVLQTYSGYSDFAKTVNGIANAYRQAKDYSKSIELYQTALARAEDAKVKLDSYAGLGKAKARLSGAADSGDVDGIVQVLMTDFKDAKRLGYHIFQIGEEYYFRAEEAMSQDNREQAEPEFQKAISIWQKSINEIDDSYHQAMAAYFSAAAYGSMGQDEDAVRYYRQVVDQYPTYKKAWYAQYNVAKIYEKLLKQDKTSVDQLRFVYRTLLENYPECPVSDIVKKRLAAL